ncbi:MAG: dihydrofolate reductase family protein [Patescibacteria group bacterium]|jgi:dihydrofolate reductase
MIKVILMMVMTADGKIAKTDDHFPDWGSSEDKKLFARVTKEAGVIIMGRNTFNTLPSPLPGRLNVVFTKDKNREEIPGVKWVTGEPEEVLSELEKTGYKTVILAGGAKINTLFLEKNLIDEMHLTIEPKIFGDGLGIFNGDFDVKLELLSMEKLNENTIAMKYKVIK